MASDRTDEPLDPRERQALDAWDTPGPPAGFADRVLAARDAGAPAADAPDVVAPAIVGRAAGQRGRTWRWPAVAAIGVAAIGLVLLRAGRPGGANGGVTTARRESLVLGGRGVAVAEAGATLSWTVDGGAAVVAQGAGDVFYRVERGGPFRVETPAGSVRVTGTCFRVEVDMRKHWQAMAGAAVGAAIVVTVYEGSVLFAGKGGEEKPVAAGQVLSASAGGGDVVVREAGAGGGEAGAPAVAALAPPPDDATREELLARDGTQRAEIERLRAQVRSAGGRAVVAGGPRDRDARDPSGRPWFDPTREDLVRFAAECRVRLDLPPLMDSAPFQIGPRMAKEFGLTDDEATAVNRVFAALHQRFTAELRALYIEATGDTDRVDDLSPEAQASELQHKSPDGEASRANQRLAQERAGLAQPPANLAALSPIERFMRLQASLGDLTEKELGAAIGPHRARALREKNGGWGWRSETAGCPGDGGENEVER